MLTYKEVCSMTLRKFNKLSRKDKEEFILTKSADVEVILGLQQDRRIYKKVCKALVKQLRDNGIEPVTSYEKEINPHRKEK